MRGLRVSLTALVCAGSVAAACKSNVIESSTTNNNDAPDSGLSEMGDASAGIDAAPTPVVTLKASQARVALGQSVSVDIEISSALASAVDLTFAGLPKGVTAAMSGAVIAPGATSTTVTFDAASDAAQGRFAVVIHGTGATDGALDLVVADASGATDKSFNNGNGIYFDPPPVDAGGGGAASAVAVLGDDAIVVAGSRPSQPWTVFRLNADGTRDKAFDALLVDNTKGALLPSTGAIVDVVVAADGKRIFVLGSTINASVSPYPVPTVVALNADGSRVASFATNGVWTLDMNVGYPQGASPTAVAADPGGGAYVAWIRGGTSFTEIRHLDPSGGKPSFTQNAPATIHALAAGERGVYAAGEVLDDAGTPRLLYAAHTALDGAADPAFPGAFGGDAGLYVPQGTLVVGDGVLDDAGTFTVTAGYGAGGGFGPPVLARLGADGRFLLGDAGFVHVPGAFPQHNSGFTRAVTQADGKVLTLGGGWTSQSIFAYLARLDGDGGVDPSFSDSGLREESTSSKDSIDYQDLAIDSLGRIVVVGNQQSQGWLVARLWP